MTQFENESAQLLAERMAVERRMTVAQATKALAAGVEAALRVRQARKRLRDNQRQQHRTRNQRTPAAPFRIKGQNRRAGRATGRVFVQADFRGRQQACGKRIARFG